MWKEPKSICPSANVTGEKTKPERKPPDLGQSWQQNLVSEPFPSFINCPPECLMCRKELELMSCHFKQVDHGDKKHSYVEWDAK